MTGGQGPHQGRGDGGQGWEAVPLSGLRSLEPAQQPQHHSWPVLVVILPFLLQLDVLVAVLVG